MLGLQETQDDLVQATLRALADLVPLLGADVVMGTSRTAVFADTKPRVRREGGREGEKWVTRKKKSRDTWQANLLLSTKLILIFVPLF